MRRLFLVRHASASMNHDGGSDFDRSLNQRGKRDAAAIGRLLAGMKMNPAAILASSARRAVETAKLLATEIDYLVEQITFDDSMYLAGSGYLLELIQRLDGRLPSAMLLGHNPGFTALINKLGDRQVENLPTCGIYCVEFDTNSWQHVGLQKGKCRFFESPENVN